MERQTSTEEIVSFVANLSGRSIRELRDIHAEIIEDDEFQSKIEEKLSLTAERPDSLHRNWREALYVLVRVVKPETVVETGVFDGLSTCYILRALNQNESGELISIDINDTSRLPTEIDPAMTGWLVPDKWQNRWTLKIGDSKEMLPEISNKYQINLFLHDSLHTYDHMTAEYNAVLPGMAKDSVFISDNIEFNNAFREFAGKHLNSMTTLNNTDETITYDGEVIDDRLGGGIIN
jgi:hypothetical protein